MTNGRLERIAVLGAGALGTILGAYIARSGRQVDLVDSYTAHVDALNANGARVTGSAEFTVPVRALLPGQMQGEYDLVFYLAKQTANSIALPELMPHLHSESIVCTMQNGLPEYRVGDYVGIDRVMGAPVGWGATFLGPGVSCLTSDIETCHFMLGRLGGEADGRVWRVRDILSLMCRTEVTNNLIGIRWCKLIMNSTFSGLSTVLGCTFGDVLDDDSYLSYVTGIADEGVDVARAAGISIEPMAGNDYAGELYCGAGGSCARVMARYRELWDGQRKLTASMLQDIEKGRSCEIDAINGMISRYGGIYNVPTPKNDRVVALIKVIQARMLEPGRDNFALLTK